MAHDEKLAESLRRVAEQLDVIGYLSSRRYLADCFEGLKGELGRFSYRAFSAAVGFGPTNYLHLICSGQRALSLGAAAKIARAFGLKEERRQYLLKLAEHESARTPAKREACFSELVRLAGRSLPSEVSREELAYFTEWYHAVVRECMSLPGARWDGDWIAGKLRGRKQGKGLSREHIKGAMALLERIGYVRYDGKQGRHVLAQEHVRTPKEVPGLAVSRYHQNMIDQGRDAVLAVPAARRDISAVTVGISRELAQELKAEIQAFRSHILRRAEEGRHAASEVYQLNIQWFPFTEDADDED